jgi:hypothetical protein
VASESWRRRGALGAGVLCLAGIAAATAVARHVGHPSGSPLIAPGAWRPTWWVGLIAAYVGWVVAIALLSRAAIGMRAALALAVLIQVTPLAAPILLTGDIYAYQKYGGSSDPYGAFGHLSDVYGPLWTAVSKLAVDLGGSSYLFRGLALCCVLALTLMAAWLTERKALAIAFIGWNPLVAVHFTGGGHVDAFMMVFALGALVAARVDRSQLAGAGWVVSVFVKWVTAPFAVLWAIDAHRRRRSIGIVGAVIATVASLALSYGLFGWTWLHAFYLLGLQSRQRSAFGMFSWLLDLGLGRHPAIAIGDAVELAAFLLLARSAWRGRLHFGLAAGVLLVLSPRFQPSYLIWPLAFAASDDDDRWGKLIAIVMTAVLLSDAFTPVLNA